jgi:hypothetical protein
MASCSSIESQPWIVQWTAVLERVGTGESVKGPWLGYQQLTTILFHSHDHGTRDWQVRPGTTQEARQASHDLGNHYVLYQSRDIKNHSGA